MRVLKEQAFQKLIRPLSREMRAELASALANMEADSKTQARYERLATKAEAGRLTGREKVELEDLVQANTVLGLLKAEARLVLSRASDRSK
jgi:DNA invertase Pin-like site-specific DNA recombinase